MLTDEELITLPKERILQKSTTGGKHNISPLTGLHGCQLRAGTNAEG